jgi:hypothetical protein
LDAKDEAHRRSAAARDALAGKQTHTWRWVIVAAAAGIGAGAAVAQFGRKLIRSREQAQLEKIEQTVADSTAAENHANGYPIAAGTAGTGPATTSTGAGSNGATTGNAASTPTTGAAPKGTAPAPRTDRTTTTGKASSTD